MKKRIGALLLAILLLAALPATALAEDGETGTGIASEENTQAASATPNTEEAENTPVADTTEPAQNTPGGTASTSEPAQETPTPVTTATPTETPEPATPEPSVEPSPAGQPANQRVTMGADLTEVQRAAVYRDFGIEEGSVRELTVTNAEERAYLEGLVPDRKIGSVALSCIYITTLDPGAGLDITIYNINYCTEQMYVNALTTAGITDAKVIVSAPFPVSGTGALTGVYKAYEDITGVALNDLAKLVGAEELVVTGELAEYIGSTEAAEIVSQLKNILDQTQAMSDAEVRDEIRRIAEMYSVNVTDAQVEQLLNLVRKLEGLDTGELQQRLAGLAKTAQSVNTVSDTISRVYQSVKDFFASIGDFFVRLFGGGKE